MLSVVKEKPSALSAKDGTGTTGLVQIFSLHLLLYTTVATPIFLPCNFSAEQGSRTP